MRNFINPSNWPLSIRLALVGGLYLAVALVALLPNAKPPGDGVDLWLHALTFSGLTIITVGAFGRLLAAAAIVFAFSVLIEVAQLYIPGRSGTLDDIAANALGVAAAVVIAIVGGVFLQNWQGKQQ